MSLGTPSVRAVVVNWNGAHLLGECLTSLLEQDLPSGELEVVVVDNASTDGSVEFLGTQFPSVRVVVNQKNLGFAGGVDAGLTGLTARYVALLNNDATFAPDAVRLMVEEMERPGNERVGATTAHIVLRDPSPDGRVLVNSTGNVLSRRGSAGDRDWLAVDGSVTPERAVFGFCGGAALLRTATLEEVGSFDASLFLYYEDTDLSWRMRAGGWDIVYVAGAVARHRHAASSDSRSPLFRYYNTRNSLVVFTRHAPVKAVVQSFTRQMIGALAHFTLRNEERPVLLARFRALRDYLRALPRTLRSRKEIWRGRSALRALVYRSGVSDR